MSLLKIELFSEKKSKPQTIALGLFACKTSDGKGPSSFEYLGKKDKNIESLEKALKDAKHFSGDLATSSLLRFYAFGNFQNVVLLGLGQKVKWTAEALRKTGAELALLQRREKLSKITLQSDGIFSEVSKNDLSYWFQAFCEGYLLAGYEWTELKSKKRDRTIEGLEVNAPGLEKEFSQIIDKATKIAHAVNLARSLGDQPPNYCYPETLANSAQKMAKEFGIQCSIWDLKKIEKEKMGLLAGVGQGSKHEPRFVILKYTGSNKSKKHVALIGKGVTFDSGGISLKPSPKMEEMKYDMMGSATVIGVLQAVAALKLPINVTGYVAAAENMPGGRAQKPSDVQTSRSGKTVEITNTDAEGRLALADALEYAQEQNPEAIIDFATLTGAVLIALGTTITGIMGNNRELISRIEEASERTAEKVWELPLDEDFEEFFKSPVADLKNSSDARDAGSSKGGTFLKYFVDKKFPWVHCDIAGTAWHRKDVNYHPKKYGSGAMVRLAIHLLENWKPLNP